MGEKGKCRRKRKGKRGKDMLNHDFSIPRSLVPSGGTEPHPSSAPPGLILQLRVCATPT